MINRIKKYFIQLEAREATKFLIIFYIVGIAGFLIPASRDLFEHLIPVSLTINIFMLLLFHSNFNWLHVLFFLAVAVFTIAIEALGVHTGWLFGEYFYGDSIPVKVFDTPVFIGINWLVLSYGAVTLVRSKRWLKNFVPLAAALLMTGFDFVMEPVAMKTGMWHWMFNEVPIQNYIMWFIVSTVIASGFELFRIETRNRVAGVIFVLQLVFFAVLNLFLP
ncbi:carotenoid biosynthesis protein [Roseimarinus sediminis]|uniref:carotenoid biosynthesis protein n=1 Tax=Roseimarinus sediminis TaxID=1610899 RepID=UPI003D1FA9E0